MWQRYAVSALYSVVFKELKQRLKKLLCDKALYTDGFRPDEINQYINNFQGGQYYFENDLSKQDRQTDEPLLNVEFRLYELLGMEQSVLQLWKTVH